MEVMPRKQVKQVYYVEQVAKKLNIKLEVNNNQENYGINAQLIFYAYKNIGKELYIYL